MPDKRVKNPAAKKGGAKPVPVKQDKVLGFAVLGMGVAAILVVGWMAVQRYSAPVAIQVEDLDAEAAAMRAAQGTAAEKDAASAPVPEKQKIVIGRVPDWAGRQDSTRDKDGSAAATAQDVVAEGFRPVVRPQQAAPQDIVKEGRAKRVAAAQVEGVWETTFLDYYALFNIEDGVYQIIVLRRVEGKPRYYARGHYTLDGAFLILTPDKTMGSPQEQDSQNRYLPLTNRAYAIEMRVDKDGQKWFAGPVDPDFPNRDPAYPLIQFSGEGGIAWTRKSGDGAQ